MMKTKTHKMLDLAIQILQAASEEDVVPETPKASRTVAGYVVRYAHETAEGGKGRPLSYQYFNRLGADDLVLLIHDGAGTLFESQDEALAAVTASVQYQKRHGCRWNLMYGSYVIDPVYA